MLFVLSYINLSKCFISESEGMLDTISKLNSNLFPFHIRDMGFGGDVKIWVYVDAYNKQMCLHMLNQDTANIIEYHRICNFCPVCGRDLSKAEE